MNVLILAAGKGQRFQDKGYPAKPLIEVDGRPMWEFVLNNTINQLPHNWPVTTYVATKSEYNIKSDEHNIINLKGQQFGALYSALMCMKYMDKSKSLLILNCDQLIDYDTNMLKHWLENKLFDNGVDGFLFQFDEPLLEPKWGRTVFHDGSDLIAQIVEKTPVTQHAHTGHYYFQNTAEFERYGWRTIGKGVKVNNEYFLSPVYNEMIADGKKIRAFWVNEFIPLGVPAELEGFLKSAPNPYKQEEEECHHERTYTSYPGLYSVCSDCNTEL